MLVLCDLQRLERVEGLQGGAGHCPQLVVLQHPERETTDITLVVSFRLVMSLKLDQNWSKTGIELE